MSLPPMLEIKKSQYSPRAAIANLLPCRVHHTGPVDPASAYWNQSVGEDETRIAYFRGRKLQGKTVTLPEQYRGVVLKQQDEENQPGAEGQEASCEATSKTGTLQVTAEFDKLVVWSHEAIADATSDPYRRCVEEWLQVADQIHSCEKQDRQDKK